MKFSRTAVAMTAACAAFAAHAGIAVGVTLSATGPAASLGIPEKNTIALLPTSMGGQKVNYIVLGHAWDAGALLQNAVPTALKKARPGTKEFRAALRDALEATKELVGVHGVFNMSPSDHLGFDQRARVMVRIDKGAWKLDK
ncbi:MAG: hypothetical protein U1A72_17345 [Sulfuritalea sp.]|nr:hypothetical protein [Sulfuritalea sp.]